MSRDMLLYDVGQSDRQAELLSWANETPGLHGFVPDYHRLQLEHWIWSRRAELGPSILDVGVENPRRWLGDGYQTLGEREGDLVGNLLDLPFEEGSVDSVILTEVLEHCADPFTACREVHRVLKSGGLLLVTSPFLWSWHGTADYRDYWRFTHEGWQLLLKDFQDVQIDSCAWTAEGAQLFDLLRRFECFGHSSLTKATTGYLVEARK